MGSILFAGILRRWLMSERVLSGVQPVCTCWLSGMIPGFLYLLVAWDDSRI